MIKKESRNVARVARHTRVRNKVKGTSECPRLAVCKTNKNIIAQIIDDTKGETLVYVSTLNKDIKTKHCNIEAAKEVGLLVAKKAEEKKIKKVVFDRGGYIYHGIIKELADSAREGGLEF